jgi:hypothetical protein
LIALIVVLTAALRGLGFKRRGEEPLDRVVELTALLRKQRAPVSQTGIGFRDDCQNLGLGLDVFAYFQQMSEFVKHDRLRNKHSQIDTVR